MKKITSDPQLWGRHVWNTLEIMACTMTEQKRKHIYSFIQELQHLLPCDKCQYHFQRYLKKHPIQKHLNDPSDFLRWLYHLQCEIKQRQERECEDFEEYVDRVIECFNVPDVYDYFETKSTTKDDVWYKELDKINLIDSMPLYYLKK